MSLFGDVRSMLHHDPDAWVWQELVALCELLDDEEIERAVDYALPLLERWPDALRRCPAAWLERWCAGDPWAPLELVRELVYHRGLRAHPLRAIVASPWFSRLTALSWSAHEMPAKPPDGRALRELHMRDVATPASLEIMLRGLPALEVLSLHLESRPEPMPFDRVLKRIGVHLSQLEALILDGSALGERGIEVLRTRLAPSRLRRFVLRSYQCADRLVADLVSLGAFEHLEALSLGGCGLQQRALSAIRDDRLLGELRELRLGTDDIEEAGWRALAECDHLVHLRRLELPPSALYTRNTAMRHLARASWPSLSALRVHSGGTAEPLVEALERADWTPHLRELRVIGCTLTTQTAARLAALPLASLETLQLQGVGLDAESATTLSEAPWLGGLTHLNLRGNVLRGPGFAAIARRLGEAIATLELSFCHIDDPGLRALIAQGPHLALRELHLLGNDIGLAGAQALAATDNLPTLRWVELRHNRITRRGHETLAASTRLHPRIRGHYATTGGAA